MRSLARHWFVRHKQLSPVTENLIIMNKMEINRKYPKWNKYHEVFVLRDNYIAAARVKRFFQYI